MFSRQQKQGISSHQLLISSLKDAITFDNQVYPIDAFVSIIDLYKLGF